MNYNKLTKEEQRIIVHKGTEMPFTGKYLNNKSKGTYICKRCEAPLYRSEDKFDSQCGWPSFDDEIEGAIERKADPDGKRIEILCRNCGGHLGHVFKGEGLTAKNLRHCVNSISMNFIPAETADITDNEEINNEENDNGKNVMNSETVYFAGGCFWGTEYYFKEAEGVISTSVGYIGGHKDNPAYEEVCSSGTGHTEVVEVVYNPSKTDFESLARLFFEIHDFTQIDRQGPDVGDQYRSEIFFTTDNQNEISQKLINILTAKGYDVATKLTHAPKYWKAEDYHQDYYAKKGSMPYCHFRKEVF